MKTAEQPTSSFAKIIDPVAKDILFRRYWSRSGWTQGTISPEEFSYAEAAGLMFKPVVLEHEEVLARISTVRKSLGPEEIGRAS